MRVRVVRSPDPTSSQAFLVVERWGAKQWERVINFPLNESAEAHDFALRLSQTKRVPVEMAVFEDGKKMPNLQELLQAASEKQSESST